jgi:hypothetical protein
VASSRKTLAREDKFKAYGMVMSILPSGEQVMLNRREAVGGAAIVLLGSTIVHIRPAAASFNLGKIFKGVATTIVHGIDTVAKPVQQLVKTSIQVLEATVREAGHAADRTLSMINEIEKQTDGIVRQASMFADQGIAQVLPLFANPGVQLQQLEFALTQAGQQLRFKSSDEEELRLDPHSFTNRNADMLEDYVNTFPIDTVTKTYNAAAGQFGIGQIPGHAPPEKGYYLSVVNLSNLIKMITIIAAL